MQFWEELSRELGAIPGVTAVGLTSKLPFEGGSNTSALVNDEVYDPTARRMNLERSSVTAGYFDAMGMKITRERNLMAQDDMSEDGHLGVVVNQAMVDKAWPDKDPIGEISRVNGAPPPLPDPKFSPPRRNTGGALFSSTYAPPNPPSFLHPCYVRPCET